MVPPDSRGFSLLSVIVLCIIFGSGGGVRVGVVDVGVNTHSYYQHMLEIDYLGAVQAVVGVVGMMMVFYHSDVTPEEALSVYIGRRYQGDMMMKQGRAIRG